MLGTGSNITLKIAHHSLQICAFAIFGSWGYFEEVRTAGANSATLSTNVFLTTTTYMLCISLTANPSPREVCQNTGEIPDSAARSLPIPSRVILSSLVAAANPASWTELLLGLLPAEAWQKLVAPPQTLLISGSEAAMSRLSGEWCPHNPSLLPGEVSAILCRAESAPLGLGEQCKKPWDHIYRQAFNFNYWEKRSNRDPSSCCRKVVWNYWGLTKIKRRKEKEDKNFLSR